MTSIFVFFAESTDFTPHEATPVKLPNTTQDSASGGAVLGGIRVEEEQPV